ncbi:uncharacterized protein LOC110831716 isoform X2 [Zootermopsis nevadensis]|uniref:uncharacterized protein LOC110831716 isoform X2 n=1 Tax=Zootermopsis nevadensis TaxID=136037 RepID=UPI000B8EB4BE|nr:uncharacterized protein LOC110831716 isoform X2 [Zootermopsis nevadensis]
MRRFLRLIFGTLYPAYASYKAVRTKNVKEYVKWMMYWIVFALFTCAETFTDVFLSFWFPFYYEIKIILVLWLLSPATKGSSILYRKFVHPMLSRREQEIDEYIAKAKEQGYHTVLHLGTKGVNYATTVLMQTAIKSSLLVYKGGGGLVNQLRRSYSLSDLSSDKESDMNRNSKALKNVPDEDDMEETDGLDPRMLRQRGYSPRRSASGSGRMEMYFPEVDVDVRQHGSSRPREPSIPLSHIRSSEDVSSGYSSAEPLYAGHHVTQSEGLASSREPLVRTASVGCTRSMRTKSLRGGSAAKRGPVAEDSELLDPLGGEADHCYQEEYFYDVSSSLSSHAPTLIPFTMTATVKRSNTPLSSLPEISYPSNRSQDPFPSELNEIMSAEERCIDISDAKQDSPDDEEDMPLYDAESDESKIPSNGYFLTEPLMKDDDLVSASVSDTSLFKDVTMSYADTTANGIIHDRADSSSGLVLSNEPLTSHLNTTNNIVPNTKPGNVIYDKAGIDFESSQEANVQNLDTVNDPLKHVELSSLAQLTNTIPEVQEASGTSAVSDVVISESKGKDESSVSELKETGTVTDETLSVVTVPPLTLLSAESLSLYSAMDISFESKNSKYDTGAEHSNNRVVNNSDSNSRHVDTDKPTARNFQSVELERDSPKLDITSITSVAIDGFGQTLQDHDVKSLQDHRISVYASVESLSPPEPPSRSSSQGSLKKEGRAGRYHKRPAPTPPPNNPELKNEDWAEDQNENSQASVWPKELDEDMPSAKDSESAVTARLVLKPGVVRSLGPDSETKAEVFVSRTPQAKHKKSKSKQGDSALSRLFVLPKNQFGGLSSFFPFWHGKQEAFTSADAQNGTPESSDFYSSSGLRSSRSSAFIAVHGNTLNDSEKDTSRSSSDVNVKELSCSPGQQRRAPLADWE